MITTPDNTSHSPKRLAANVNTSSARPPRPMSPLLPRVDINKHSVSEIVSHQESAVDYKAHVHLLHLRSHGCETNSFISADFSVNFNCDYRSILDVNSGSTAAAGACPALDFDTVMIQIPCFPVHVHRRIPAFIILAVLADSSALGHGLVIDDNSSSIVGSNRSPTISIVLMLLLIFLGHESSDPHWASVIFKSLYLELGEKYASTVGYLNIKPSTLVQCGSGPSTTAIPDVKTMSGAHDLRYPLTYERTDRVS
ncbi:hypothetical protein EVAR_5549_1 [Eumeta japonica]|uniref:Uncharacterized protein n=1 Tax=Eumeta variegata TaxID=151549 RepID=A0A4C1U1F5_EUMVA|nr:hypothetical protein EVAR_5549_1 [Eumeta japonica]